MSRPQLLVSKAHALSLAVSPYTVPHGSPPLWYLWLSGGGVLSVAGLMKDVLFPYHSTARAVTALVPVGAGMSSE